MASIVRLKDKISLRQQSGHICPGQVRKHSELPVDKEYEVTSFKNNCLRDEPGVLTTDSISRLPPSRRIPIFLVNTTNKTLSFKAGTAIARINLFKPTDITLCRINHIRCSGKENKTKNNDWESTDVPSEHKPQVIRLLQRNSDLFAKTDAELSHTDMVRMQIDTGEHSPIKLKPYRTQLNNRKVIEKAIYEMMDAEIITRSRSE